MKTPYFDESTSLKKSFSETVDDTRLRIRTGSYDPDDRPAPPVNLRVLIRVREVKTRLEFKAIVRCDPLTANTCQADIERYIFQIRFTNAAGVPQEYDFDTEHPPSKVVLHTKRIDGKEVFDSDNDEPHVAWNQIPHPKSWHIQGRARILDKHHRKSDWSPWTTPILPIQEGLPKPPAPVITNLDFLKDAGGRDAKYEGRVQFNEVVNWDVPGGDKEDDMARYMWKVQVQIGGAGAWRLLRKGTIEDKDNDEDDSAGTGRFNFGQVHRRHKYRVKMRSVDRWNRRGDWTTWYPTINGVNVAQDTPPAVSIVDWIDYKNRRGVRWEAPEDAQDINNNIAKIEIWMARNSSFTDIVAKHHSGAGHGVFRQHIRPADRSVNFYLRLRTIDGEGDKGPWQPSSSGQVLNGIDGDEGGGTRRPVGTIRHFHGPLNKMPEGYILANGDPLSTIGTYAELFGVIGYTYGGSGTTFYLPDLRRRALRGVGTGQTLGDTEGQAESNRVEQHGNHKDHKHKHHHKRRRKDHSDDGGGDSDMDATPHDHYIPGFSTQTGQINTVNAGNQTAQAAGPAHEHSISAFYTNRGGQHTHGVSRTSRRTQNAPYIPGFGYTAHMPHEDEWVEHSDGASIYQDSLTGGWRSDGTVWNAGPTDPYGNDITIDEEGAASGHKHHGHMRAHPIIAYSSA